MILRDAEGKKKKKDEHIKRGNIFSKPSFNTPEKETPPNTDTHLCQVKKWEQKQLQREEKSRASLEVEPSTKFKANSR